MSDYILLIPTDEAAWDASSQAAKDAMYAKHHEFGEALAARGHKVKAAAELSNSRETRVVTGDRDDVVVTEGPYAESAEQLSGFYLIDTDDIDDLVQCVGILAEGEKGLELRRCNP
ncbi:YciI family protein [Nocardioides sp. InS609-2]|uniref:YciI family protein n=1 Tax=Nocardioides sp. InS609-2 TaxID=2760705 RepID=UPI0020C0D72B|nr:YciI family protein [Nocardioides sp. InS609-2]